MSTQPGNLVIDHATDGKRYDQESDGERCEFAEPKNGGAMLPESNASVQNSQASIQNARESAASVARESVLPDLEASATIPRELLRDNVNPDKLVSGKLAPGTLDPVKLNPRKLNSDSNLQALGNLEVNDSEVNDSATANRLLHQLIGEERFDMWFTGEHSLIVENGVIIVRASNEFTLESIKTNYSGELKKVVQEGQFAGLSFRCEQQAEQVLNSEVATSSKENSNRQIDLFDVGRVPKSSKRKTAKKPISGLLAEFVVDPENEMAWRACQQALSSPGEWSPLYLYGNSGTGKTHLLEGLCAEARRRSRTGKVMLLSAENFTSDYVGSLTARTMPMFRKRYRELDFFLIDDIHFLDGKKSTLDELQHTIEAIGKRGGQVVITADRSPSELEFATPEFINRVACGLACEISLPTVSTKRKIIKRIAKIRGLEIRNSVLEYIASNVSGDVRLISGALNQIKAFQFVKGEPITLDEAKLQLRELVGASRKSVSIQEIEKAVCNMFGLEKNSLRSASKVKAISQPRMLAMWLSRKYTRAALSEIGDHFGGRSHSTVISAKSKVEKWVERDDSIGIRQSEFSVTTAIRRIEHELRIG